HLTRFLRAAEPTATLLRTCAIAIIQGAVVYVWTQAAPLLIRVFWGWTSSPPPLAAAYYLQELGNWVVAAAVIGVGVRSWLTYRSSRDQLVGQRRVRLAAVLKEADLHLAFSR